jgi:excinuclease ABC subunit C
VPVYLVLDDSPAKPGLRVTHLPAPGRNFGPYLGGLRARLALSALHRTHPLAYAGSRLTGAERDLADRRGIAPADRESLLAGIAAILDREPGAVAGARRQLTGHRDRAAAEERYEQAGQIQAEIAALEWITSPQRAARLLGCVRAAQRGTRRRAVLISHPDLCLAESNLKRV